MVWEKEGVASREWRDHSPALAKRNPRRGALREMARKPKPVEAGSTIFVQACARMMGAAWIRRQMIETSTAPLSGISGIAYAMRYTFASDIGMSFELAIKSVAQGLSPQPDGQPQVLNSHELLSVLWDDIPKRVREEIDSDAEDGVCGTYGKKHLGKVLPFAHYLAKHSDFLDRTVGNRYAIRGETQWKSDNRFIQGSVWSGLFGHVSGDNHDGKECVDGIGVLMAYWWALMRKACSLRWEDSRCEANEELAADRDEAWNLVNRAIGQMFGQIGIMTREELRAKRLTNRNRQAGD